MKRTVPALLALVLPAAALSACGSESGSGASGDGVSVVTSFYALEYLAERVGGDDVTVANLTAPGQEPHDLELGLQETAELSDADVAVYLSGFQPAVDEAIEQNGPERVVDAADSADLVALGEDHGHDHEGEAHADEHAEEQAEESHDEEEHAEGDGHDHGEVDPHFWTDPVRMAAVAEQLEGALADADPDNAQTYAANLADLERDLTALDEEYHDGLADCAVDTVVVSHDAFGYLGAYGLDFESIAGISPDAEPGPARLAELQDVIEETGVTTVFSETLVSPALAETLANEVGVQTAVLDPIEGLTDETSSEDYLSLMRSNLEALRAAGDCR